MKPHLVVGPPHKPYMLRWHLLPRNPFLNIYLHKFLNDDDDRALHDHPWPSVSIMLRGAAREVLAEQGKWTLSRDIKAGRVVWRSAMFRHRLVILTQPTWTLFITGPRIREWGFWCDGTRFVRWDKFTDPNDPGQIGKGCDQ